MPRLVSMGCRYRLTQTSSSLQGAMEILYQPDTGGVTIANSDMLETAHCSSGIPRSPLRPSGGRCRWPRWLRIPTLPPPYSRKGSLGSSVGVLARSEHRKNEEIVSVKAEGYSLLVGAAPSSGLLVRERGWFLRRGFLAGRNGRAGF